MFLASAGLRSWTSSLGTARTADSPAITLSAAKDQMAPALADRDRWVVGAAAKAASKGSVTRRACLVGTCGAESVSRHRSPGDEPASIHIHVCVSTYIYIYIYMATYRFFLASEIGTLGTLKKMVTMGNDLAPVAQAPGPTHGPSLFFMIATLRS